jgi:NIMA (never in mitosis gene a)-related kinase
MEYADNGDLYQKITRHQKEQYYLKEEEIWRIFIQVVQGLKSLHDVNILHRDLKSANVFLNRDGSAKLGDMNVSKIAKKGLLYTQTGTPYYASPEVWKDQPYDSKSDIWSLGCVLYESVTLKPPFRAEDMAGLYKKVVKGVYPKIPTHFTKELEAVIRSLLVIHPQQRPSCNQILDQPSVKKMGEKLFGDDYYQHSHSDAQSEMLKTIRIPKNLLYLTDRLPKPSYEDSSHKKNASSGIIKSKKHQTIDDDFRSE